MPCGSDARTGTGGGGIDCDADLAEECPSLDGDDIFPSGRGFGAMADHSCSAIGDVEVEPSSGCGVWITAQVGKVMRSRTASKWMGACRLVMVGRKCGSWMDGAEIAYGASMAPTGMPR